MTAAESGEEWGPDRLNVSHAMSQALPSSLQTEATSFFQDAVSCRMRAGLKWKTVLQPLTYGVSLCSKCKIKENELLIIFSFSLSLLIIHEHT